MEVILNEERDTDSGTYIGFGRDVNDTPKTQSHAPCFTFLFRRHKLRQEISFETFILQKRNEQSELDLPDTASVSGNTITNQN